MARATISVEVAGEVEEVEVGGKKILTRKADMMKRLDEWEERSLLFMEEEVAIIVAKAAVGQREAEKCDNRNSDNESVQYVEI